MTDLKAEFIKCRDALACAMNWLDQGADARGGYNIPADKLEWLDERLDAATRLADKLAAGVDLELDNILQDEDYLREAWELVDLRCGGNAVDLCDIISRRHGVELTLDQAKALLNHAGDLCGSCLKPVNEETGYCGPCSEPGSAE